MFWERRHRKKVIAFVDLENITQTVVEKGKIIDFEKLGEFIRTFGEIVFADIYLPENYFDFIRSDFYNLNLLGFRIICCKKMADGSDKIEDTVDINMIKDGMKYLEIAPDITHLVIVGHDKHMAHLINEAKNRNKEVIIIGTDEISSVLKKVVSIDKIKLLPTR